MSPERRLAEAGLGLPETLTRLGSYVPGVRVGSTVYVSGQTGTVDGRPVHVGRVGDDLGLDEARASARLAACNALAALRAVVGDLEVVLGVARTTVYVRAPEDFTEHPRVADAVTEVLQVAFGDAGRGARSAVGVSSLPQGAPVEIDLVVLVDDEPGEGAR